MQRIRRCTAKWAQWSDAALLETKVSLQDAQHVIAGEYGFLSWPKLVATISGRKAVPVSTAPTDIQEAFFEAVRTLKLDRLRTLLEAHPSLVHARIAGGAHLNGTMWNDKKECWEIEPPDSPRQSGALNFAARSGQAELAHLLLEYGADPDVPDGGGSPPVVHAGWYGGTEVLRVLLEYGADPNQAGLNGYMALECAASHGREDRVDLLRAYGAEVDFFSAVTMSPRAEVEAMLDQQPDLIHARNPFRDRTPFWYTERLDILELLLERGADIDSRETPKGMTRLLHAALTADYELLGFLVEKGADINARVSENTHGFLQGDTAIHAAVCELDVLDNRQKCVKILLAAGADIDTLDGAGQTALDRVFTPILIDRGGDDYNARHKLTEFFRHLGGKRAEELS